MVKNLQKSKLSSVMPRRKEWNLRDRCRESKQKWSVKCRLKKKQDNKKPKDKLLQKERLRWLRQPGLQQNTRINLQQKRQQRRKL